MLRDTESRTTHVKRTSGPWGLSHRLYCKVYICEGQTGQLLRSGDPPFLGSRAKAGLGSSLPITPVHASAPLTWTMQHLVAKGHFCSCILHSFCTQQSDLKSQGHSLPCIYFPDSSLKITTWKAAWSGLHSMVGGLVWPTLQPQYIHSPSARDSQQPLLECAKLDSSPRLELGARTLLAGSLPAALSHPQGLSSDTICSERSSGLLPKCTCCSATPSAFRGPTPIQSLCSVIGLHWIVYSLARIECYEIKDLV